MFDLIFVLISTLMGSQEACKIGPQPARQRNDIRMAFRWRADSDPRMDAGWVGLEISTENVYS